MLRIKAITILIVVVLSGVFLTTCAHLEQLMKDPVVTLDSVNLTGINLQGTDLLCKIKIQNPNPIDIPFPEIDWELYVNENFFVKGIILNNTSLKKRGSTIVDVPVNLNYLELFNSVKSLIGTKQADYKIALAAKFNLPVLGEKVWDLEHAGIFPVLQPPKLSMPSFKIDKLDFTKIDLLFSVNVENPNEFELPMPKFDYDYQISNNSFIKSSLDANKASGAAVAGTAMLAAAAATPVVIQLSVNYLDLLQKIVSLVNANEAPSILSLKGDFGLPAFPDIFNSDTPFSLPILKVPVLNFNGISVKNFNPASFLNIFNPPNLDFEISLEVDNRNNFAMNVKDLAFNFAINNERLANTKIAGSPQIPANRKTTIPLTFSINPANTALTIVSMITNGTNFAYTFGGNMSMGAALPGLDDFTTPFNFTGNTRLTR